MLSTSSLVLAIVLTVAAVVIFARGLVRIVRVVRVGAPAPGRLRPVGPRLGLLLRIVLGHTRFQNRPWIRAAHWVVMVSFPLLVASLVTAYGQLVNPGFTLPFFGTFTPWLWLTEIMAFAGLLGGAFLAFVRARTGDGEGPEGKRGAVPRTSRFRGSNMTYGRYVEFVIIAVLVCVLVIHAAGYAYTGSDRAHYPISSWLGDLLAGLPATTLGWIITIVAAIKILVSLSWFVVVGLVPTMGVAWHRFLALLNVYARQNLDGTPALGAVPNLSVGGTDLTIESLEELDEDEILGIRAVTDISWKGLLDTATCTECGRCQDLCPAWNSNKPLSPKTLVTDIRDAAFAPFARAAGEAEGAHAGDLLGSMLDGDIVPDVISPEVLWACTTCGACVDQCPVDIEHLDLVIGLRRHQVLMESAFPEELTTMFTAVESKGNPWGMSPRKRLEWAKGLDFEVPQVGVDVESLAEVDYLFWVGCAGAYDDRAKKTTRAIAELLHTAGVSFAVLGDGESCTGDPARRAGNEVLFQMLAAQNIEVLNEAKATKIVVSCAHCFNTIANEYPSLGGTYEVVHHTQLINRLVRDKLLTPVPPPPGERRTITYHDPCYLGRHNRVYSAPRELIGEVAEMELNRERGFCCGAGGAHAFMEDRSDLKINEMRARQAAETGASVIATACPFCTTMLSDGSSAIGSDVEVTDVANLVLAGVRRGQAAAGNTTED